MPSTKTQLRAKAFNQVRFQFSKLDYSGKSEPKVLNFANVIDTNKLFQKSIIFGKSHFPRKKNGIRILCTKKTLIQVFHKHIICKKTERVFEKWFSGLLRLYLGTKKLFLVFQKKIIFTINFISFSMVRWCFL
jgi:hypothetical protein